jgi:hypothetical protein
LPPVRLEPRPDDRFTTRPSSPLLPRQALADPCAPPDLGKVSPRHGTLRAGCRVGKGFRKLSRRRSIPWNPLSASRGPTAPWKPDTSSRTGCGRCCSGP